MQKKVKRGTARDQEEKSNVKGGWVSLVHVLVKWGFLPERKMGGTIRLGSHGRGGDTGQHSIQFKESLPSKGATEERNFRPNS